MKHIEIIEGYSNIFGFITSIYDDNGFTYLSAFFNEDEIKKLTTWLETKQITEFAVLRNIYVDDNLRGSGVGRNLVNQFILKTQSNPILLLASPDEDDFNLTAWYEKMGFEPTPFICEDGPLIIKF